MMTSTINQSRQMRASQNKQRRMIEERGQGPTQEDGAMVTEGIVEESVGEAEN